MAGEGNGCVPAGYVAQHAPVVSLGCLHVELDIEQFAASYIADSDNRRMLQFSLRRDREEAAVNLFGATNPA